MRWNQILVHKSAKVSYAGTACVALSLDTEQFQTLPSRAYDVKGLRVQIPSNASPNEKGYLEFNGLPFDGRLDRRSNGRHVLFAVFTTCLSISVTALVILLMLNISWIDLIEISKYCNQLIDLETNEALPIGSEPIDTDTERYEPRFAINTVIGSQADAYGVIQDLASVFRGMVFWKSDTVQLAADHGNLDGSSLSPIHVFTNSNVVGGGLFLQWIVTKNTQHTNCCEIQ